MTTTVEGNILGQAWDRPLRSICERVHSDQTESATAPVELTQGQSSDTATQGAALDQTISEGPQEELS